jgi:hypothetical protein
MIHPSNNWRLRRTEHGFICVTHNVDHNAKLRRSKQIIFLCEIREIREYYNTVEQTESKVRKEI